MKSLGRSYRLRIWSQKSAGSASGAKVWAGAETPVNDSAEPIPIRAVFFRNVRLFMVGRVWAYAAGFLYLPSFELLKSVQYGIPDSFGRIHFPNPIELAVYKGEHLVLGIFVVVPEFLFRG